MQQFNHLIATTGAAVLAIACGLLYVLGVWLRYRRTRATRAKRLAGWVCTAVLIAAAIAALIVRIQELS